MINWSGFVRSNKGGYMRLEDFCNSGPRGNKIMYTSGIVMADEELLVPELGERIVNQMLEKSIDGWDPLMDLLAAGVA